MVSPFYVPAYLWDLHVQIIRQLIDASIPSMFVFVALFCVGEILMGEYHFR
jgi:hypothetical protein